MTKRYRAFTRLAQVYDLKGHDRFSIRMVEYTFRLLKKFHFRPERILDLCCGTGTAAVLFAEQGYEVTGLDASREMLAVAKEKAAEKKVKINLVRARLPEFNIRESRNRLRQFDLVTSYFDSLNYILKEEELLDTFRGVAEHLRPGGLFIFDMNTARALQFLWGDKIYAGIRPGIAWIWESLYFNQVRQADLRATCFVKKGKLWEMFEEIHTEKAYVNSVIKSGLRSAGFEILGFYDCFKFEKPDRKSNRIAVVARKREKP
ncbi:putative methyltransferase GWCH70_2453 [Candidatus Zixiibacteriota bacterium]|nr:putative methyltransferase GWCH70_2453 [candidate division Zixibacteria bacterium]